jgi:Sec7 domain/F-box-like
MSSMDGLFDRLLLKVHDGTGNILDYGSGGSDDDADDDESMHNQDSRIVCKSRWLSELALVESTLLMDQQEYNGGNGKRRRPYISSAESVYSLEAMDIHWRVARKALVQLELSDGALLQLDEDDDDGDDDFGEPKKCAVVRLLTPLAYLISLGQVGLRPTIVALECVERLLEAGVVESRRVHVDDGRRAIELIVAHVAKLQFRHDSYARGEAEIAFLKALRVLLQCVRCATSGTLLRDDTVFGIVHTCAQQVIESHLGSHRSLSALFRASAERVLVELIGTLFAPPLDRQRRSAACLYELFAFVASLLTPEAAAAAGGGANHEYVRSLGLLLVRTVLSSRRASLASRRPRNLVAHAAHASSSSSSASSAHGFALLADEFLFAIAARLPARDVCSLAQCSRRLRSICKDDRLWRVLFARRWPGQRLVADEIERMLSFGVSQLYERRHVCEALAPEATSSGGCGVDDGEHGDLIHYGLWRDIASALASDDVNTVSRALDIVVLTVRVCPVSAFAREIEASVRHLFARIEAAAPSNYLYFRNVKLLEVCFASLVELCADAATISELCASFDAQLYSANLFEEICAVLAANVVRGNAIVMQHPASVLSMDGLLAVLRALRDDATSATTASGHLRSHARLQATRALKAKLAGAVELFNANRFKRALASLADAGIVEAGNARALALFLRRAVRVGLGKRAIGRFLGSRSELAASTRAEFVRTFSLAGRPLLSAFRVLLDAVTLASLESQMISRLLDAFAVEYHRHNSAALSDPDSLSVLCHSIVMLNMDRYNPAVSAKMSFEQWCSMNRQIDNGADVDATLLRAIYVSIERAEIRVPQPNDVPRSLPLVGDGDEAGGDGDAPRLRSVSLSLFLNAWQPMLSSLASVFKMTVDDAMLSRAVAGFEMHAHISARFDSSSTLEALVECLCDFPAELATADDDCVAFADNKKARLATATLFSIVHRHADHLVEGWACVVLLVLAFHRWSLVPDRRLLLLLDDDSPEAEQGYLLFRLPKPVPIESNSARSSGQGSTGLFGLLSWFGGGGGSASSSSSALSSLDSAAAPLSRRDAASEAANRYVRAEEREAKRRCMHLIDECRPLNVLLDTANLSLRAVLGICQSLVAFSSNASIEQEASLHRRRQDAIGGGDDEAMRTPVRRSGRDRLSASTPSVSSPDLYMLSSSRVERDNVVAPVHVAVAESSSTTSTTTFVNKYLRDKEFEESDAIVCLDVLASVALRNSHRVAQLAPTIFGHWRAVIRSAATPMRVREKAVQCLVTVVLNNFERDDMSAHVLGALEALLGGHDSESPSAGPVSTLTVAALLKRTFRLRASLLTANAHWARVLLQLIACTAELEATTANGFKMLVQALAKPSNVASFNVLPFADALHRFAEASTSSSSSLPLQAMELLYTLFTRVPSVAMAIGDDVELARHRCWHRFLLPMLAHFAALCKDPRNDARSYAMALLQRALLSDDLRPFLADNDHRTRVLFDQVILPLLADFVQSNDAVASMQSGALEEIRLRALTLLSKIFVHIWQMSAAAAADAQPSAEFHALWQRVLHFIRMFALLGDDDDENGNSGASDAASGAGGIMHQAVYECVKSILHTMTASQLFAKSADGTPNPSAEIWRQSFESIEQISPDVSSLVASLAPAPIPVATTATASTSTASDAVVAQQAMLVTPAMPPPQRPNSPYIDPDASSALPSSPSAAAIVQAVAAHHFDHQRSSSAPSLPSLQSRSMIEHASTSTSLATPTSTPPRRSSSTSPSAPFDI